LLFAFHCNNLPVLPTIGTSVQSLLPPDNFTVNEKAPTHKFTQLLAEGDACLLYYHH